MSHSGFQDLNAKIAVLIILDTLLIALTYISFSLYNSNNYIGNSLSSFDISFILAIIWFMLPIQLFLVAFGLYNAKLRESFLGIIVRISVAFFCAFILSKVIEYLPLNIVIINNNQPALYFISFSFIAVLRSLTITYNYNHFGKRRVLVLGCGKRAELINSTMRRKTDRVNFEIVGFIKFNDEICVDHTHIVELDEPIEKYASDNNVDEIVIALDERRNVLPSKSLFHCKLQDILISDVIDFIERESGQIAVNHIYPSFVIYNKINRLNLLSLTSNWILNLLLAFIILIITCPIILLTILAIKFEDGWRSPVIYKQKRIGLNGKEFSIFKFRSMCINAETNGEMMSSKNDSRITKVGKFIRKYRIDELPQLYNVIVGDMFFVGPRPERPQFSQEFESKIPYYAHRYNVKPGLTGWAQLKYPYGDGVNDATEKLKFDLYYIKHRSIIFDILILIRTTEIVFFGKGR